MVTIFYIFKLFILKTFIRLIILFVVTLFCFSITFAYELSVTEKYKLDSILQKLEKNISIKGENYRNIYIDKLTEAKRRITDYRIIAYVDYIIDSLDLGQIFNHIGNQGCSSITKYINGHTYYLSYLDSGNTYSRTTTYNISNGFDTYKQSFSCYNGTFSTSGNEEYVSTTCNSSYSLNGRTCYYNPIQNCSGGYRYYNGFSSYLDAINSGSSRQISFNIGNGNHYITYYCSNGYISEQSSYTSCNSGYVLNGNICEYKEIINNCSAISGFLVGVGEKHSYIVPAFNANTYTTQTVKINVAGGVKTFSQNFYCSNGKTVITSDSPEKLVSFVCDSGYIKSANGTMCEKIQGKNCPAHVENVNGHAYNLPLKASGTTQIFYYKFNINGIYQYKQNFSCNNGITSKIGAETIYSCMPTHDLINGKCVKKLVIQCLIGTKGKSLSGTEYILNNNINSGTKINLFSSSVGAEGPVIPKQQLFVCNPNKTITPEGVEK